MDVKAIRVKALYSQKDFAKVVGVSLGAVQKWEQGRAAPSLTCQRKIIEFCKKNNIKIDL